MKTTTLLASLTCLSFAASGAALSAYFLLNPSTQLLFYGLGFLFCAKIALIATACTNENIGKQEISKDLCIN